jgi:hypothetical protein
MAGEFHNARSFPTNPTTFQALDDGLEWQIAMQLAVSACQPDASPMLAVVSQGHAGRIYGLGHSADKGSCRCMPGAFAKNSTCPWQPSRRQRCRRFQRLVFAPATFAISLRSTCITRPHAWHLEMTSQRSRCMSATVSQRARRIRSGTRSGFRLPMNKKRTRARMWVN